MRHINEGKFKKVSAAILTAALLCSNLGSNEVLMAKDAGAIPPPKISRNKTNGESSHKDENSVIIVVLDDDPENINGDVGSDAIRLDHDEVFEEINTVVSQRAADSGDPVKLSTASSAERVADYFNIFDGMAVLAPESSLDDILELESVKSAYQEKIYTMNAEESGSEVSFSDLALATGAESSGLTGKGQTIAVLDSSLLTSHEVFGTNPQNAKYSKDDIAEIKEKLGDGADGAYISSKIPFVYDYADKDANVSPNGIGAVQGRGTHIAGLAVGHSESFKGAAPDAQLVFCKVSPDRKNTIAESDVFSALDDCLAMNVDEVNLSFSSDVNAFSSGASSAIWTDVLNKFSRRGIMVNVAAGKTDESMDEISSDFPDSGNIKGPGALSGTMAVAGISIEDINEESRSENSIQLNNTWGPTPELSLKPDISAPAGIVSASSDSSDSYSAVSGVFDSVACISGLAAQLREHIEKNDNGYFDGISGADENKMVTSLLMSTASPQMESDSNIPLSPRLQGAGMVNVEAASKTKVYASVDGSEKEEFVKAELGDNPDRNGEFEFTVTLHNMSDEDKSFTPKTLVLTENIEDGLFSGNDFDLEEEGFAEVTYSGEAYEDGEISVGADETVSYSVNISLNEDFENWIDDNCKNGAYVEGYTLLTDNDTDNGVDLSIPFLGFYGDWGRISPVFDESREEYINPNTGYPLGINPLTVLFDDADIDGMEVDHEKIIVSDSSFEYAPTVLKPISVIKRGAAALSYEYRDKNEGLAAYYSEDYVGKSGYKENGDFLYAEDNMISDPVFDADDIDAEEGKISLKKTLLTAGPSSRKYSETFDFYYDKTDPKMSELSYSGKGDSCTVNFKANDNMAIAGFSLGDPETGELFYYKTSENGGKTEDFSVSIAEASEEWHSYNECYDLPLQVILTVWDYGLNYDSKYLNFAAAYQGTNSKYGLETYELTGVTGLYINSYAHIPYFGNQKKINAADLGLSLKYEDITLDSSEIILGTEVTRGYDGMTSYLSVYLKGIKPAKGRGASEKSRIKKTMRNLIHELKDISIAEIEVYPRTLVENDRINRPKEANEADSVRFIINKKGDDIRGIKAVLVNRKDNGKTKRTVIKLKEDVDYFSSRNYIYFEGYQVQGKVKIS